MARQIPERDNGGHWYVAEAVPADDAPGWGPPPGIEGCFWYKQINGVMMCAIRTPDPLDIEEPVRPVAVTQIVGAIKPRGRLRGR